MILADKIIALRKKQGWSQEELADRLDVSRQSVSKWEGNLSTPEIDKIITMSELFGVSTDYLLKDEYGDTENISGNDAVPEKEPSEEQDEEQSEEQGEEPKRFDSAWQVRQVTREEAERYLAEVKTLSWWIAIGVMLCILSPIALIMLGGIADFGWISENLAAGLGLSALFVLIAAAIVLFIPAGMRLSKFEYTEKESICLSDDMHDEVCNRKNEYEKTHILLLTIGVLLCVLGVAQLVVLACLSTDTLCLLASVCGLLALCAVGVMLLVRTGNIYESYQRLLQEGEFAAEKKKKSELISNLYWCIALVIYLGVSFLTGAWHLTWVIWPVAAVISPIIELIETKRNQR